MRSSLKDAREQLRAEREAHRRSEEARIASVLARVPAAAWVNQQLERLMSEAPQRVLSASVPDAVVGEIARERARLQTELGVSLVQSGLDANALSPTFLCDACRDTGTTGYPVSEDCVCIKRRSAELLTAWSGLGSDAGAFEKSDLSLFSDVRGNGASQRARMRRILELAEAYAEAFPNVAKPNIFMTGESGLGKTFVAQCVTRRVAGRGIPAVMMNAGELSALLRACHLGLMGDGEMDGLAEVPLLVLDDLGSEPMYENITIPHLFTLLNQRKLAGRATIIITNLMPPEFGARYTERVLSRALDTRSTELMLFTGEDLRLTRKTGGRS